MSFEYFRNCATSETRDKPQGKVKDAMDWLTLQERKLQKMLKDSENATYYKNYEVSMTLNNSLFVVYS